MSRNVVIPVRLTRFRRRQIWKCIKFIRRPSEKENIHQNVAVKPIKKNVVPRKSKEGTAEDVTNAVANGTGTVMKGFVRNAFRYGIKLNARGSTVVNIVDNTVKSARGYPIPFIRVDAGARGMKMPHINVNPRVTGVADPHLRIPAGALNAAPTAAKVLNVVNKVALPVAIAIDAYQIGTSVHEDAKNGSSRNTINTVASVAGSWTGGFGGAASGAAIGSVIFPGIGTFVGGLVGGIAGAIGGSIGASVVSNEVMENMNHDVQERICKNCGGRFKVRIYAGEKDVFLCENCR